MNYFFYDFETTGVDPRRDRPMQVAGLRTDAEFNPIGQPLARYCRLADDVLPHPEACLITGLTPQRLAADGVSESELCGLLHAELAHPDTCAIGYNSIRFDDEFTRFSFFRNFLDPYAWAWQNGNSRWDLIDAARAFQAFRPEGLAWPQDEDGHPSFRLEALAQANRLEHRHAHDALSDVTATIGLARLLRQRNRKLFDVLFELRNKRVAQQALDIDNHKPVAHVTRMFPAAQGCASLVMPVARHPVNPSSTLVFDLRVDPAPYLDCDVDELRRLAFSSKDALNGEPRLPVKEIRANQAPVILPAKIVTAEIAQRIALDLSAARRHYDTLRRRPDLFERLRETWRQTEFAEAETAELALYDGFIPDADRNLMAQLRATRPELLKPFEGRFQDDRLNRMLLAFRARNFPDTLDPAERAQWAQQRRRRLTEPNAGGAITLEHYRDQVTSRLATTADDAARAILTALLDYGETLSLSMAGA